MEDATRRFNAIDNKTEMKEILTSVYHSLVVKGYNPINQLVGYILSEDPTYITNYNNARSLICRLDRDELHKQRMKRKKASASRQRLFYTNNASARTRRNRSSFDCYKTGIRLIARVMMRSSADCASVSTSSVPVMTATVFPSCAQDSIRIANAILSQRNKWRLRWKTMNLFGAKWSMFCRLKVRSVLAANVAGTLKVAPLQILKFPGRPST